MENPGSKANVKHLANHLLMMIIIQMAFTKIGIRDKMVFKKKHTVTFYSPGTLFSESSTKDIDSWDTKKAVEMADSIIERYNAKPYAFVFRTLKTHDPVSDGEGGFLKVEAKKEKESGYYFLGGKLETYDEVLARNEDSTNDRILLSNMRNNEYWIICTNTNSFKSTMPFGEDDKIVDASGVVIKSGNDPKYVKYRAEQLVKRKAESGY